MGSPWNIHLCFMEIMERLWIVVDYPWIWPRIVMDIPWNLHGTYAEFHGISVDCHGLSTKPPWNLHHGPRIVMEFP